MTQKMSRDEIRNFFRAEGPFDLSPCLRFSYPEDFDREKFDAWLALSGIAGNPSVEDVLVNIEVAERAGDRLLFRNAGVLFFAKNVRRFLPEAYITCLLGRGADKVHILDRKDFDGGIVAHGFDPPNNGRTSGPTELSGSPRQPTAYGRNRRPRLASTGIFGGLLVGIPCFASGLHRSLLHGGRGAVIPVSGRAARSGKGPY